MGGMGDSPVPVGDPPTGRAGPALLLLLPVLEGDALLVPPGGSPGGTGQWPVLPRVEERMRLRTMGSASAAGRRLAVQASWARTSRLVSLEASSTNASDNLGETLCA